jgi:GTP-binding protein
VFIRFTTDLQDQVALGSFKVGDSIFVYAGMSGSAQEMKKLKMVRQGLGTLYSAADTFKVSGRGELHLGILIETMRREGYEFQISRPEVFYHKAEDGALLEPYEEVHVETSADTVGVVVEMLGSRRGKMMDMQDAGQGMTRIVYIVPTRGLLGFRYQFLTSTRGEGVMHTIFHGYDELAGPIASRSKGSIVAWEAGTTTAYSLKSAEDRGQLFIGPGVSVYEGMVVGENARGGDLPINVCKKKHLTNMRASGGDMEIRLVPPRQMSLDEAIEYLSDDELLEITPESYRIRKRILSTDERGRQGKKAKEQLGEG